MAHEICVIEADTKNFAVQCDGSTLAGGLSVNEATDVAALLARCFAGDQDACDELDARGIEPPVLEPDATPLPCSWDPDPDHWREELDFDDREELLEAQDLRRQERGDIKREVDGEDAERR